MRNITILGSTGSIGTSTLKVVDSLPGQFKVIGLTANSTLNFLLNSANATNLKLWLLKMKKHVSLLKKELPSDIKIVSSDQGVIEAAIHPDNNLIVSAIVGSAGLYPTYYAIENG